jgi:hypothetical protein
MNKVPENITLFTPSGCLREETILEYIQDKLPGDAIRKVEMHLADCPLCSDALEGYMEMNAGTEVRSILEKTKTELFKGEKAVPLSVLKGSASEKKRPTRLLYLSLAASLALLIAGYFIIRFLVNGPQEGKMMALKEPFKIKNEKTAVLKQDEKKALLRSEEKIQPATGSSAQGKSGGIDNNTRVNGPGYMAWSSANQNLEGQKDRDKTPAEDGTKVTTDYSGIVDAVLADNEVGAAESKTEPKTVVQTITGGDVKNLDLAEEKQEITVSADEKTLEIFTVAGKPSRGNNINRLTKKKESEQPVAMDAQKSADVEHLAAGAAKKAAEVQQPVVKEDMNNGVTEYDKGNYHIAADRFEQVLQKEPDDQQALYYGGMSYYYNHQNDKALQYLNKLLKNKTGTYYQAAQWQIARIYLETGQLKPARKVLNEIIDGNGTYKQNAIDAVDILDK